MKLFGFLKKNKKLDKIQENIEEEFKKGNIILPTGVRDYEDYSEFKEKTSHIEKIEKQLSVIENKNGK